MSAGAGSDSCEKAPAAERLGHGDLVACPVQHDVGSDAVAPRRALIQIAHAAQVAFALFAYVADEEHRAGQRDRCVDQSCGNGEQAGDAGSVVACAGRYQSRSADLGATSVPAGKTVSI